MEKRKRVTGKEFISDLEKYKSTIEDKSHISRTTFILSLISLFFIFGDLTLNQENMPIIAMPFGGLTETMFLVFLLIMVFCWLMRLAFLYTKAYTFFKIKGIGYTKLRSYIYSYRKFSKPLSERAKTKMTEIDYEIRREIYVEVRNSEPKHPNDILISFRDPTAFYLEYFIAPLAIFFLALLTVILLLFKMGV